MSNGNRVLVGFFGVCVKMLGIVFYRQFLTRFLALHPLLCNCVLPGILVYT